MLGLKGLIPAYAGKTRPMGLRKLTRPAHPRVCGENDNSHHNAHVFAGSSPRMRGKPNFAIAESFSHRLIPAYAGKTWPALESAGQVQAHPRVCGENFDLATYFIDETGSSPRMRGKPCKLFVIEGS